MFKHFFQINMKINVIYVSMGCMEKSKIKVFMLFNI